MSYIHIKIEAHFNILCNVSMFAPYATMKLGIAFSEKTGVVYHSSGQFDEINLHLIHQNVHKNIKKI